MKSEVIREWFLLNQRDLPWRRQRSPYRVWISEVMLQQTQVTTVIPYFHRWMARFPSLEALAEASLDEVIKMWEGLGYYARARHLHEGARLLVERYQGRFPEDPALLATIKGMGPYTCGALLAFAFGQKRAAVDSNVLRLFSRYYAIEAPIESSLVRKRVTQQIEAWLPDEEPWIVSEALIELGAIHCKKSPLCKECPLQEGCAAYQQQRVGDFPRKRARPSLIRLHYLVAVVCREGELLLGRGIGNLYAFPSLLFSGEEPPPVAHFLERFQDHFTEESGQPERLTPLQPLVTQCHAFTHHRITLFPYLFRGEGRLLSPSYTWHLRSEREKLSFSSGHKRIFREVNGLASISQRECEKYGSGESLLPES